jgi:ATP-dependent helicase HrpB
MLDSARDLLRRLGALEGGRITSHGREMARLSVHPRLAHMLIKARDLGAITPGAELAALLSERDLLRGGADQRDADIRTRLEHLRGELRSSAVDRGTLHRARQAVRDIERQLGSRASESKIGEVSAGALLAFAYPDRIGKRRAGAEGRYTLANGRGAHFAEVQGLAKQDLIVAVDLDDRERDARILLAAPLDRADIDEYFADGLERTQSVEWNEREQAVVARRAVRLDALVLEEKPLHDADPEATREAMLTGIRSFGLNALPWSQDALDLQARIQFVRALDRDDVRDWPDASNEALSASLAEWLAPWLDGVTRRDHLARVPLADALRALLSWEQQKQLDDLAPTHLTVPTGSRIRIDYLDESAPAVSVRLQEVFGLEATPRLGGGRVPVTFKLLSPAQRPVQVTRDLASFWRGAYADVRKDMRGRYPRHYWPENPLEAEPTRGVRRRT